MPCPHNEISIVQRSQQQSAVAAAAYQSGEKLFCEYDQEVKHYPEKRGIVHNEILLPANAPQEYADRNTLSLIPTHAGISLITVLPEQLQSPLMTAEWEHRLKEIERGEESPETFMQGIRDMVCELVKTYKTVLGADVLFPSGRTVVGKCPRCGSDVTESKKGYFCERNDCHFGLWRDNRFLAAKKINLTKKMAEALLKDGKTYASGIFSEKTGKTYDAYIVLEDDGTKTAYRLEFERGKANGKQYS